ncbi:MAG: hypothetical protein PUP93_16750 [Rhizonema sp. NSF051]|nr:hypothetical protein [Rhizonema sp. NSF051]
MTNSIRSLYESRCRNGAPYYWQPQEITKSPFAFNGEFGIKKSLERILASSEYLEIDVAQYTGETWKKLQGEVSPICKELLHSNIADEGVHSQQISKALKTYEVDANTIAEAKSLSEQWRSLPDSAIEKATALEIGVFLAASLPIMLRCGGHSLTWIATQISRDEQRHAATNRYITNKLYSNNFSEQLQELVKESVTWIVGDLDIKQWKVNKDWFLQQSQQLMDTGIAPKLSQFTSASRYSPPFEDENSRFDY